jgi:hypothetical protein
MQFKQWESTHLDSRAHPVREPGARRTRQGPFKKADFRGGSSPPVIQNFCTIPVTP